MAKYVAIQVVKKMNDPKGPTRRVSMAIEKYCLQALSTAYSQGVEDAAKVADKYKAECGLSMSRQSSAQWIADNIRTLSKGGGE